MHAIDRSDSVANVRGLKEKPGRLTQQQAQTRKKVTFIGMITDEAKDYDVKHHLIMKLLQQVADLERVR
jgi:hypothetical protein